MDCDFGTTAGQTSLACSRCLRPLVLRTPAVLPVRRRCSAVAAPASRSDAEVAALAERCRANVCGAFDPVRDACRRLGCETSRHTSWQAVLRGGRCPNGQW